MPYLHKADMNIHYEYVVTNPSFETIVLIHGIGLDMTSWDLILPYIQDKYNYLRYDLRGHGDSDRGSEALSLELFVDDLSFILKELDINIFHAVTHGAGSLIAVEAGIQYPEMVKTEILLSIPIYYSVNTARKYVYSRKELITDDSIAPIAEHVINHITLLDKNSPEVKRLYDAYHKVSISTYFEMLEAYLTVHASVFDRYKQNRKPILILSGDHDLFYPPVLSGLATSFLPYSRYLTIPNSSNMVFYDQPLITFNYLDQFIQSAEPKPIPENEFFANLHAEMYSAMHEGHLRKEQAQLKVTILNQFQVLINNTEIIEGWSTRNAKRLLIYLLFHPSVTRDQLCADLWGHEDIKQSRQNLRVYLAHLRKLLRDDEHKFIFHDREHIHLRGSIECDAVRFTSLVHQAMLEDRLERKAELCKGIFAAYNRNMFWNYTEDWIMDVRVSLESQLLELAEVMAQHYLECGNLVEAINCYRVKADLIPEDDSACELIMNLYKKINNDVEAEHWRVRMNNCRN
ncbi:alpha/beta hydrolase [Paenibacillus xylaniclasticus]|uniref:alpha/beta hydrolase n=1 Tax=Paenibacillus xylaniclasticus TaxID=588083 RepID=UPI000FDA733B|nr:MULTISPECIES: alpha/beta hydrolase [Paenibacillus]GFN31403.1 hypothetical protein PCURB6_16630 [Paenibacillus curdlanolyticus]